MGRAVVVVAIEDMRFFSFVKGMGRMAGVMPRVVVVVEGCGLRLRRRRSRKARRRTPRRRIRMGIATPAIKVVWSGCARSALGWA